jgi:hypothetical protein
MSPATAQILYAGAALGFVALGAYHFRRNVSGARVNGSPFRIRLFGSLCPALGVAWGALWIWAGHKAQEQAQPLPAPGVEPRSDPARTPAPAVQREERATR